MGCDPVCMRVLHVLPHVGSETRAVLYSSCLLSMRTIVFHRIHVALCILCLAQLYPYAHDMGDPSESHSRSQLELTK